MAHFRCRIHCGGFTLTEAMIALLISGVACSAMLLTASQSLQTSAASSDLSRAALLAQDLMEEISARRWSDPEDPGHWGLEQLDEAKSPTRAAFDDLDDYDGWSGFPQTRAGMELDELHKRMFPDVVSDPYARYSRTVQVQYVSRAGDPMPPGQISNYRLVTVSVYQADRIIYRLSRIFNKPSRRPAREHWFDPDLVEPLAAVRVEQ